MATASNISPSYDIPTGQSDYRCLCKRRRYLRAKITRICNDASDNLEQISVRKKQEYLQRLESMKAELEATNMDIQSILPDTEDMDRVINEEET